MDITTKLLNDWADGVRNSYLNDTINPTDSIKKIVAEKGLNRKQAQRLCEASNVSIKRALRNSSGPDDVQFPLASIMEVWEDNSNDGAGEVSKEASLRPESFLEKFAEYFYDSRSPKKEGSLDLTCDKLAMVAESLSQRARKARREASVSEYEFKKVANDILDYITDEARATGSVDESYTSVSTLMPKYAALIDRFYKFAQKNLEVDLVGIHVAEAGINKVASQAPNPNSEIAQLFGKYASLYDRVQQARSHYSGCLEAKRDTEAQLRKMILAGN